jgi:predicted site-specific integrase-resolvase
MENGIYITDNQSIVTILTKESNPDIIAYAYCSSKDQYNKTIGRKISYGRAIKLAKETGIL